MATRSNVMKTIRGLAAAAVLALGGLAAYSGAHALIPDGGKPASALSVVKLALASTEATDFDAYTPTSRAIPAGSGFFIYAEARNLATTFAENRVKGQVSVDVLIANDHGETIIAQDNVWTVPFDIASASHRSIARAWLSLQVAPMDLPEGRYELLLRFHDTIGATHADQRLEIDVRKPVEPAPVLQTAQR